MAYFRAFFLACLLFCIGNFSQATEQITQFDVTIDVAVNGDFTVTERLTVNVEGKTIQRGIFRDLPRYVTVDDYRIPMRYKFLSVTRNGQSAPYSRESVGNAKRLRIGEEDVFLPYGLHTYEIKYLVKDQIRRTPRFDEVYWNVTGNYWRYPILRSSGTVNMPDGAQLQLYKAFTGRLGQSGEDATFSQNGHSYTFVASRPFEKREGLTIALRFDKGVIAPEPASTRRFIWWVKNGAVTILSLSLLSIIAFYYRGWNRVGRDPLKDPVFARYAPPKNYSPAAVSYIRYRGIKGHRAITATLMALAIKGCVDLETTKKRTVIKKLNGTQALNKEEVRLFGDIFHGRTKKIVLDRKPNASFNLDYQRFQKHLAKLYGEAYFKWNGGYIALGLVFSLLAIGAAISQTYGYAKPFFWWAVGALLVLNILFVILLPAPTKKGQKIRAEIEGFELYLKTAEKQKLNAVNPLSQAPPPMTTEHYEAMLPYAIALGVEAPWTKYFEKVMPVEAAQYNPSWSGVHTSGFSSFSGVTDSMVSSISSGVSSAAPQSSGSSSGGGFSGGGGGGGGGGGW